VCAVSGAMTLAYQGADLVARFDTRAEQLRALGCRAEPSRVSQLRSRSKIR
jgi:hypothetical protein